MEIPKGKVSCSQGALWERFPSLTYTEYGQDMFHSPHNFYFAFGMCICKNTIQWQSSCDQEETRLKIKPILDKARRKRLKDPRPLMTSLSLIKSNALPLNYILSSITRALTLQITLNLYLLPAKIIPATQWVVNQVYGNYSMGNHSGQLLCFLEEISGN